MRKEEQIFRDILKNKGMRITNPRLNILNVFLSIEKHVSVEELFTTARASVPGTGYATVHRTLKLLCECGLARQVDLGDRISRFEHNYNHEHHDHLICTVCGKTIEFHCVIIEEKQEKVAKQHGFTYTSHKMQIYGCCSTCRLAAEKG